MQLLSTKSFLENGKITQFANRKSSSASSLEELPLFNTFLSCIGYHNIPVSIYSSPVRNNKEIKAAIKVI
jgi:hypothetical protein